MGGKRPDQYQIAPGEAGASDYKSLPQKGKGGADETVDLDRKKVAETEHEVEAGPYNPGKPAPSVHARAGEEVGEDHPEQNEDARQREADGSSDPREKGVGG